MSERKIIQGALFGAVGDMVMAMWSMIALAATGDWFFAPVNLIAHSLWRRAPIDAGFIGAAFALGIIIHMIVSVMLGVMIAIHVRNGRRRMDRPCSQTDNDRHRLRSAAPPRSRLIHRCRSECPRANSLPGAAARSIVLY